MSWERVIGTKGGDFGFGVAGLADGRIAVAGNSSSSGGAGNYDLMTLVLKSPPKVGDTNLFGVASGVVPVVGNAVVGFYSPGQFAPASVLSRGTRTDVDADIQPRNHVMTVIPN